MGRRKVVQLRPNIIVYLSSLSLILLIVLLSTLFAFVRSSSLVKRRAFDASVSTPYIKRGSLIVSAAAGDTACINGRDVSQTFDARLANVVSDTAPLNSLLLFIHENKTNCLLRAIIYRLTTRKYK